MIARFVRIKKSRPRRRGPFRSPAYRKFIASKECLVSGQLGCDACHLGHNGLGSKAPDSTCVPLKREYHQELHRIGQPAFEKKYGLDLAESAAWFFNVWQQKTGKVAA